MARQKAKVRYALLAALDLAEHYGGDRPVKLQGIAARTQVPSNYLVHILLSLKRRALVNSARGSKGGYWLLKPPASTTVAEIVVAVDPRTEKGRSAAGSDPVARVLREAENRRWRYLADVTLADLLRERDS